MNMLEPTTAWDRPPTDQELTSFYGKDKPRAVADLIVDTITKTVRTVPYQVLSVPYVKHTATSASIASYPLVEVFSDYGTEPKLMAALMAVIEKSDCPLVAAYRLAVAERFAEANAEEVEELQA